jgi:hypothetical protein
VSLGIRPAVMEEEDLVKSWEREWRARVEVRMAMCGRYRTGIERKVVECDQIWEQVASFNKLHSNNPRNKGFTS